MKNRRKPTKITLDAYAASHRAVREMKEIGELSRRVKVRSSQYLNNLVEQDHRRIKQRLRPMLGFKRFDHAAVTISGIELAEKIKKGSSRRTISGFGYRLCRNCGTRRLQLERCRHAHRSNAQCTFGPDSSLHQNPIVEAQRVATFPQFRLGKRCLSSH